MLANRVPHEDFALPAWRFVFRHGFAPQFSADALVKLAAALKADSIKILQQATCEPSPTCGHGTLTVARCCPVAFLAMVDHCAVTVAEVEERFADACFRADVALGEPTACRRFLNWADDTPRHVVLPELLAEIETILAAAAQPEAAVAEVALL